MKDDTISRQGAIDICNFAIDFWHGQLGEGIVIAVRKRIEQLPAVQSQPEIIRCKDCKWGAQDEDGWWYCVEIGGHMGDSEKGDGFCSDAERRTE